MEESLARQVVRAFVARINAQRLDGIVELITHDHVYVDALGATHQGRAAARQAWIACFALTPDYHMRYQQIVSEGETLAIFGWIGGGFYGQGQAQPASRWELPAAWKVVVRGTEVAECRTYTDPQPLREIAARLSNEQAENSIGAPTTTTNDSTR